LQGCTSHDLGQNFARVFNIKFQGKDGKEKIAWQTCWGFSTRSIGGLVMVHGDDAGLVIPPKIAPLHIVVIPIFKTEKEDRILKKKLEEAKHILKDFKIEVDERREYSPGWKFNEWEIKGVPLRIEIGSKEIKEDKATLVRRDNGEKYLIPFKELAPKAKKILDLVQKSLFEKSKEFLRENLREVSGYKEFKDIIKTKRGFIKAFWCESQRCETKIKEETKATTRCLPYDSLIESGKCIYCGKRAKRKWIFAQAY